MLNSVRKKKTHGHGVGRMLTTIGNLSFKINYDISYNMGVNRPVPRAKG